MSDKPAPPQPSWDCDGEGRKRVAMCSGKCRWWATLPHFYWAHCSYPYRENWPEPCTDCDHCYPGQMLGPEGCEP
jgi:hypothetical protein